MFVRCRHLRENETQTTLFRFQFGTGFVKLFKLDLEGNECDLSMEMPSDFHVVLDFLPMDVWGVDGESNAKERVADRYRGRRHRKRDSPRELAAVAGNHAAARAA